MPFEMKPLSLKGAMLIVPRVFEDPRGFFMEVFKTTDFDHHGLNGPIRQINHSASQRNILRGLHCQKPPFAQAKTVRCLDGKIFDVIVDLRQGSPTYGQWLGETLSSTNRHMLFVPEGFAHGFYVLSDTAEVEYFCSEVFHPESEIGLIWNDPDVNIAWPLVGEPLLSDKDRILPTLKKFSTPFSYENMEISS